MTATLDDLFAMVPDVRCKGLCTDACTVIGMGTAERERVDAVGGKVNDLDRVAEITSPVCPSLTVGRCSIYADRPLICRLYGAAEGLECPHGCRPASGKLMSRRNAQVLLALARTVDR